MKFYIIPQVYGIGHSILMQIIGFCDSRLQIAAILDKEQCLVDLAEQLHIHNIGGCKGVQRLYHLVERKVDRVPRRNWSILLVIPVAGGGVLPCARRAVCSAACGKQ